jgi:DNA-binding NtrC family response regulator
MVRVLVVEDEDGIRELLIDTLSDEGFEIIGVETADAAAPLLRFGQVALLVTDIDLPGALDGIALAQAARDRDPTMPVVFISGRQANLDAARVINDPVSFLLKPFSLTCFMADVHRLTTTPHLLGPTAANEWNDLGIC